MRTIPLIALLLAGCDNPVSVSGFQMEQFFPFDGNRTWEFVSSDGTLDYRMVATLDPNFTVEEDGLTEVFEVSYEKRWEGDPAPDPEFVRDILWSSDGTFGTRIWGLDTPFGTRTFDPPIQLTDNEQLAGSEVVTVTGDETWTSTFEGNDTCPVIWTDQWGNDCIKLVLDDGGAGSELAGEYWAITQYNLVAFRMTGDTGVWQLSYASVTYEE